MTQVLDPDRLGVQAWALLETLGGRWAVRDGLLAGAIGTRDGRTGPHDLVGERVQRGPLAVTSSQPLLVAVRPAARSRDRQRQNHDRQPRHNQYERDGYQRGTSPRSRNGERQAARCPTRSLRGASGGRGGRSCCAVGTSTSSATACSLHRAEPAQLGRFAVFASVEHDSGRISGMKQGSATGAGRIPVRGPRARRTLGWCAQRPCSH